MCPWCSNSALVRHIRRTLHSLWGGSNLLYSTSNMSSGLHVWLGLREPPTVRDADEGCHQPSAQCLGQNEAAADRAGKQTKRGLVGVWRLWAGMEAELWFQPLWETCSPKSSAFLIPNQHNVSRGDGKRSPVVALLRPRLMCRPLRGFQWSPTLA